MWVGVGVEGKGIRVMRAARAVGVEEKGIRVRRWAAGFVLSPVRAREATPGMLCARGPSLVALVRPTA